MEVHAYGHNKHFKILPHVLSKQLQIKKISTFVSRYIFLLCCNTICIFQNLENILLKKMSKVLTPTSPVTRQAPKAF